MSIETSKEKITTIRTFQLHTNVDNHLPLAAMTAMLPQVNALPGAKPQASIQYGD